MSTSSSRGCDGHGDGHRYHMGGSAPGSSLARFKRGFGALEQPHAGYRFERLPLTAMDAQLRRQLKRVLRFRDSARRSEPTSPARAGRAATHAS